MKRFGDSTLDFELRCFIPKRDEYAEVIHDLATAIDRRFSAANIEIAFPQRDLNIRGLENLNHAIPKLKAA
jgi:potassium efflux system protein